MTNVVKGAAATKLIENATTAPGVFGFAELLDSPNIQQVSVAYLYEVVTFALLTNKLALLQSTAAAVFKPPQDILVRHLLRLQTFASNDLPNLPLLTFKLA